MYIPFVDQVIAEIKSRFDDESVPVVLWLKELLKGSKADADAILEAAKVFESDVIGARADGDTAVDIFCSNLRNCREREEIR